ncbi:MAG: hypothetical protein FWD16_01745 [Clostridia bacterium]|nr:hypothetical protein [Clostridia bacterium]
MKSNQLSDIRPLWDGMQGHNFGLPDCVKFIMERVGAHEDLSYWDIAAITGDTVAQVYNRNKTTSCEYCVSGYLAGPEHIYTVFSALGYNVEYIEAAEIAAERALFQDKVVDYINCGVPVLAITNINRIPGWQSDVGTYPLVVGYDNYGQTLKLLVGGTTIIDYDIGAAVKLDLAFVGSKTWDLPKGEILFQTILSMPRWLSLPEKDGMYFGAAAFRAWAEDINAGRFEDDNLALWENYGVYVCNLATSGGRNIYMFRELAAINPGFSEWAEWGEKIQQLLPSESPNGEGKSLLWVQLEELGGGMDMDTVRLTMRDKAKRAKVAEALLDYADKLDEALELLLNLP